jgi:hypothetical protein
MGRALRLTTTLAVLAIVLASIVAFALVAGFMRIPPSYSVTFVIDSKVMNKFAGGRVRVVMQTPEGPVTKTYSLKKGSSTTIKVEIPRRTVDSWINLYMIASANLPKQVKSYTLGGALPTVALVFDLYNGTGRYTGVYVFSPIRYYLGKGYDLRRAASIALSDPFRAYAEKPVVRIRSVKQLGLVKRDPTLPEPVKSLVEKAEKTFLTTTAATVAATPTASCQPGEVVWNNDLYSVANNPPSTWYERIGGVSSSCIEDFWYWFATVFSKAYYYPASSCSMQEAVEFTEYLTGVPEGVYTMDQFLYLLADKHAPLCRGANWADVTPTLQIKTYQVPIISTEMIFIQQKPIIALATFGGTETTIYVSGLSYKQTIMNPADHTIPGTVSVESCFAMYSNGGKCTIVVPISYLLQGDGVIVVYEVELVSGYYRVVPVVVFTPIYSQYVLHHYEAYSVYWDPSLELLDEIEELTWSKYASMELSNYYTYLPVNSVIYEDTTSVTTITGYVAGAVTSPIKSVLELVISTALGVAPGGAGVYASLASFFFNLAKNSLSHAEFSAGYSAYTTEIKVMTSDNTYYLPITVYKYTVESAAGLEYKPLLSKYAVIVGPTPGPPGALGKGVMENAATNTTLIRS